jgi:hypothetical protein
VPGFRNPWSSTLGVADGNVAAIAQGRSGVRRRRTLPHRTKKE